MSYAAQELGLAVLELFGEAQQRSRFFCEYRERDAFIFQRGSGASAYRCEVCRSASPTHRCVLPGVVPPEGFSCLVPKPPTGNALERLRARNRERHQQSKRPPLPKSFRVNFECPRCGAHAPEHRCPERSNHGYPTVRF